MQPSTARSRDKIATLDPVWKRIREDAEAIAATEPALASFVYATVLSHDRLEDSICHRITQRLAYADDGTGVLRHTFEELLDNDPTIGEVFRADLSAVYERDPACNRLIEPLLYFKGFHALEIYRVAHALWHQGRCDFALLLQSQCSRTFGVDIHPAARIGRGIMLDHATGITIGETATVDDNVSMLHGVTLGGTGKETGDRHPKIGRSVMIGAGAKVLGNIKVGHCVRIASGSVVLQDVPPNRTVAGVPARDVGYAGCSEPARTMNQLLAEEEGA